LDTRREIGFAMIVAVGAEALACKIMLRQPNGRPVAFGPLQHRLDMPIILAVAKRFGMQDDLMSRIDKGLAIIPLHDPMGGLHFR
jgi:hypothetical protein